MRSIINIIRYIKTRFLHDTHLAVEDHGSAGPAKALVGGGGDDVRERERGRYHARRHQAADVRHVGQQPRSGRVRDLPHAGVVDVARVRASSRDDELFRFSFSVFFFNLHTRKEGGKEGKEP